MKKKDVFEELIEAIERNAVNNEITITNVKLWAKSWRDERKLYKEINEFGRLSEFDDGFDGSEVDIY